MSTMGDRIRDCRKGMGLTLEELAEKVGVKKSAVSKWERGMVENIKRSTILKMSAIFDCDPTWLMGYEPNVVSRHAQNSQNDNFFKLNRKEKPSLYDNIKGFIEFRKANYSDLADNLGVDVETIHDWENGTATPDAEDLESLCYELKITPNQIFAWDKHNEYEDFQNRKRRAMRYVEELEKKKMRMLKELETIQKEIDKNQ